MINAIALDDEAIALEVIKHYAANAGSERLNLLSTFTRPTLAMDFIKENKPDLLFLDINMPSQNGMELSKLLPEGTMIIFTTAYSQYAAESYERFTVDYLVKPFTYERFLQALEKAEKHKALLRMGQSGPTGTIQIKADYKTYNVALKDVIYVQGMDDYARIVLENERPIVARVTMKKMETLLGEKDFIRCHKSYIVNKHRVLQFNSREVTLGDKKLPVGKLYEEPLLQALQSQGS